MNLITTFLRRWPVAALVAALCALPLASAHAAGDPKVNGEILVKLKSTAALQPLLDSYPVTLVDRFGARPIYRLRTVGTARVNTVLADMALDPNVMIAEANSLHSSPEARRNMPWTIGTASEYAAQWAPQALHLVQAHALSTGAGVRVAVLDTGVDLTHPELAGRLLPGRDFVDGDLDPSEVAGGAAYGHGTHVAGLVAMVAPDAKIMPLRVLDANGFGNAWVLAEAILHAIDPDGNPLTDDGAHVINLSLGSLNRTRILDTIALIAGCGPSVPDDAIADRTDPGYTDDALRCQNSQGAVVVAAAGNDGSGSLKEYPAAEGAFGLIAIGATQPNGTMAAFSNRGPWVDLAAPGLGITSTLPGGAFGTWSGTSMASPLAAGTAALVRARFPTLTLRQVAQRLRRSSATLCTVGAQQVQIDAAAAVADGRVSATPLVCN